MKDQLATAIRLAVNAHHGQQDKIGMPYILHPLAVMASFDRLDCMIVAVLHDVLEDTDCHLLDLLDAGIDPHLWDAVLAITHREGEPLEHYWRRIKANGLATLVKVKDIEHNLCESRLCHLSLAMQGRLRDKYRRALEVLTS